MPARDRVGVTLDEAGTLVGVDEAVFVGDGSLVLVGNAEGVVLDASICVRITAA